MLTRPKNRSSHDARQYERSIFIATVDKLHAERLYRDSHGQESNEAPENRYGFLTTLEHAPKIRDRHTTLQSWITAQSCLAEQGERTPPRTGTPGYIPPELVWSGVEAGPENDVFSFGVLMLETFIQPDLWENNMFVHRVSGIGTESVGEFERRCGDCGSLPIVDRCCSSPMALSADLLLFLTAVIPASRPLSSLW